MTRPHEWTTCEPVTARERRLAAMTCDPPDASHRRDGITDPRSQARTRQRRAERARLAGQRVDQP